MPALDEYQEAAATTDAHYAMVIACAGSGKTTTMAARVAHLVGVGADPGRMLVCTFTVKAAGELRARIGVPGLHAGTIHSVVWRLVVRPNLAVLGIEALAIADEADSLSALGQAVRSWNRESGSTLDAKALKKLLAAISRTKAGMDGSTGIAEVRERYDAVLAERGQADFDDVLSLGAKVLADDGARQLVAGSFDHLMVDEFQDTNRVQVEIVQRLASEGASLFIVGDADQSIYGFRGADPTALVSVKSAFPGMQVFHLPTTYRCPEEVTSLASKVIGRNPEAFPGARAALRPYDDRPGAAKIVRCGSQPEQGAMIAAGLAVMIRNGAAPESIAVLYRSRRVLSRSILCGALQEKGVLFRVAGDADLAEHFEVKLLCNFARLCLDPDRFAFCLEPLVKHLSPALKLGIGKVTWEKLCGDAEARGVGALDILHRYGLQGGGSWLSEQIKEGRERCQGGSAPFLEWAVEALEMETVLGANGAAGDHIEELLALAAQMDADGAPLADLVDVLVLEDDDSEASSGPGTVTVSTIHAAKGLEWRNVIVAGLDEGTFPDFRSLSPAAKAEERRLLYVAITRAKESLVLTCSTGCESSLITEIQKVSPA